MPSDAVRKQSAIRFGGDFELDVQSYRLRRSGRVLKLERVPMEILILLIERRTQIVTREEIVEKIWGKDILIDFDNSINGAIRKIRQVLRDDSDQPRFIQTITGQGYRFIASAENDLEEALPAEGLAVLESERPADAETSDPAELSESKGAGAEMQPLVVATYRRRWVVAGVAVALLAGVGGFWLYVDRAQPDPPDQRLMLAVLPFQNLTGDPSQEYFTDGMTEEMITELGSLDRERLGVIGRTTVSHYKNKETALDQIGRELGVQYVIEGSVRRDADRIRVTAQLIQTKDQTHVWSRRYDREPGAVLSLQSEIAQEIADEVRLTIANEVMPVGPLKVAVTPPNHKAYDLYVKGQYFFNKRSESDLEQAASIFQQAIDEDPKYARAYAGLADANALMGGYSGKTQAEFIKRARAAALKSLEIDPRLAEGHTALALIVQNYDWDWQTAEREYRRAIELDPNYATAHHWYAEHLMWRARFGEAIQEIERARQLDPLSLIISADYGAILFYSRQYDRAIDKWNSVLEMDPGFRRAHLIASAYVEKGVFDRALATAENHPEVPASVLSWSAYVYGRFGQTVKAQRKLQELLKLNRLQPVDPMLIAWAYVGLGDKDEALTWLERANSKRSVELVTLKVNPGFDPLREDPRFQEILKNVGLAD